MRVALANLILRLVRRYFIGRLVVQETCKAAVEGRILSGTISDGVLTLTWVPLGGGLDGIQKISAQELRIVNKTWVFYA